MTPRRVARRPRYTIESYMRPCLGACPPDGTLDPPTARCDAAVDVQAGHAVVARVLHDGLEDACSVEVARLP